ncbi:hypothetical protein [Rhodococcus ruber]
MDLGENALTALPVPGPAYPRRDIGVGIVHFGVGGFHRAHQAMRFSQ